jgi:hypothetical protein
MRHAVPCPCLPAPPHIAASAYHGNSVRVRGWAPHVGYQGLHRMGEGSEGRPWEVVHGCAAVSLLERTELAEWHTHHARDGDGRTGGCASSRHTIREGGRAGRRDTGEDVSRK